MFAMWVAGLFQFSVAFNLLRPRADPLLSEVCPEPACTAETRHTAALHHQALLLRTSTHWKALANSCSASQGLVFQDINTGLNAHATCVVCQGVVVACAHSGCVKVFARVRCDP